MTVIVGIVIGLALIIFLIFVGWPLYNTYRSRGQGADVREGDAYLEAKNEWEHAEAAHETEPPPSPPGGGGPGGIERGDTPLRPSLDPAEPAEPAAAPGEVPARPATDPGQDSH